MRISINPKSHFYDGIPEAARLKRGMTQQERIDNGYWGRIKSRSHWSSGWRQSGERLQAKNLLWQNNFGQNDLTVLPIIVLPNLFVPPGLAELRFSACLKI